jgi:hypothetical protein
LNSQYPKALRGVQGDLGGRYDRYIYAGRPSLLMKTRPKPRLPRETRLVRDDVQALYVVGRALR